MRIKGLLLAAATAALALAAGPLTPVKADDAGLDYSASSVERESLNPDAEAETAVSVDDGPFSLRAAVSEPLPAASAGTGWDPFGGSYGSTAALGEVEGSRTVVLAPGRYQFHVALTGLTGSVSGSGDAGGYVDVLLQVSCGPCQAGTVMWYSTLADSGAHELTSLRPHQFDNGLNAAVVDQTLEFVVQEQGEVELFVRVRATAGAGLSAGQESSTLGTSYHASASSGGEAVAEISGAVETAELVRVA